MMFYFMSVNPKPLDHYPRVRSTPNESYLWLRCHPLHTYVYTLHNRPFSIKWKGKRQSLQSPISVDDDSSFSFIHKTVITCLNICCWCCQAERSSLSLMSYWCSRCHERWWAMIGPSPTVCSLLCLSAKSQQN